MPRLIATLATNQSFQDLLIFLKSLSIWYTPEDLPHVYIFSDSAVMAKIVEQKVYPHVTINNCLDRYSFLTRASMESIRVNSGKTLWYEFQVEKMNLLNWVFLKNPEASTEGVFYLDSDICFFGKLPSIPDTALVAVSPHFIAERDEARFGKYNGGFLWVRSVRAVNAWAAACPFSRFHEQAALECFDSPQWEDTVYKFPVQNNYGWWRLWQGRKDPATLKKAWTFFRNAEHSGILVDGLPLLSVHTHFVEPADAFVSSFNEFVIHFLKILGKSHPKANMLLKLLTQ